MYTEYASSLRTAPCDWPLPHMHLHTAPRPKLKRFQSYEEALSAVSEIMAKEAQVGARGGMLGAIDEGEGDGGTG